MWNLISSFDVKENVLCETMDNKLMLCVLVCVCVKEVKRGGVRNPE